MMMKAEHILAGKRYNKRKKPGILARMADALLTLIDRICEGIGCGFAALMRGIGRGLWWIVKMIARGVWLALRALAMPFAFAFRKLGGKRRRARQCLRLTGEEFEHYFAKVLEDNGFQEVEVTRASGDQGVDILAERNGRTYAIQCKNYAGAVGNAAVQEAYAGAQFYGCDVAAVVCPGTFTYAARELAKGTGVVLWDGERLERMMRISGRKPKHEIA